MRGYISKPKERKILKMKFTKTIWDEHREVSIFNFSNNISEVKSMLPAKRNVFEMFSKFFDTTGLTQSVVIFFQKFCKQNLFWDECFPGNTLHKWKLMIH